MCLFGNSLWNFCCQGRLLLLLVVHDVAIDAYLINWVVLVRREKVGLQGWEQGDGQIGTGVCVCVYFFLS